MNVNITYKDKTYDTFKDIRLIQDTAGEEIYFTLDMDLTGFTVFTLELKNIIDNNIKSIDLTPVDLVNGKLKWITTINDTSEEGIFATELTVSDGNNIFKAQLGLLTIVEEIK